jgi:hypothetical protein
MLSRPAILLDVDGPLNPFMAKPTRGPAGYHTHRICLFGFSRPLRVWLDPSRGPWLLSLAAATSTDLVWAVARHSAGAGRPAQGAWTTWNRPRRSSPTPPREPDPNRYLSPANPRTALCNESFADEVQSLIAKTLVSRGAGMRYISAHWCSAISANSWTRATVIPSRCSTASGWSVGSSSINGRTPSSCVCRLVLRSSVVGS